MKNLDLGYMANTRISSRYKQVMFLVAAIVIGMIISATMNAIPSAKIHAAASINAIEKK